MRDLETRIAEIQKQQDQLKNKEKELKAKAILKERKQRTRRLIILGGAVESVLGELSKEEIDLFVAFLKNQEARGSYVSRALHRQLQKQEPKADEMFVL